MKKNLSSAGSEAQYDPRTAGEHLHNKFSSDSKLFPDTHLCVDLKLWKLLPGRMPMGTRMEGTLARDAEDHFAFIQKGIPTGWAPRRNPLIWRGKCVNVHRRADGKLYPTFNRPDYTPDFTFQDFCREAAGELLAVTGLAGGKPTAEA
ncbi:MAG: hypothetical protein IJ692_02400 [Alloprevotella sp.]|nr:hypothetical protein [Alloprevotella sp.]